MKVRSHFFSLFKNKNMSLPPLVLKFCVHIITIIILLFLNQHFWIKYEEEVIYMMIRFLKPSPCTSLWGPEPPSSHLQCADYWSAAFHVLMDRSSNKQNTETQCEQTHSEHLHLANLKLPKLQYLKSILSYLEFLKETVLRSQMCLYHMWVIYNVSNIWVIGQKYPKVALC